MKKLLNNANPSTEGFKEFSDQMKEVKNLFKSQLEGKKDIEELVAFIKELIENQDSDGYWKLIDSDDIPFDSIIEYWKYPTVLFTSMMIHFLLNHPKECIKLKGFNEVLLATLNILERGKLVGHGFSSFSFKINA